MNIHITPSALVRDHPNALIFITGVIGFVVFYLIAHSINGLNSGLFSNLSASSLIIAVTVLAVDMVREKHQRLNLQGAAVSGYSDVQMANFGAVTLLGDHHFHDLRDLQDEYIGNLKTSKSSKSYIDDYLTRLLGTEHERLLDNLTVEDFKKLRKIFVESIASCDDALHIYGYAFSNELRSTLIEFRQTVSLAARSFTDSQIAAYITNQNERSRTALFISLYLEQFQRLQKMNKY